MPGKPSQRRFNAIFGGQFQNDGADVPDLARIIPDRKIIHRPVARFRSCGQFRGDLAIGKRLAGGKNMFEGGLNFGRGAAEHGLNGFADVRFRGDAVGGGEGLIDGAIAELAIKDGHTDGRAAEKSAQQL